MIKNSKYENQNKLVIIPLIILTKIVWMRIINLNETGWLKKININEVENLINETKKIQGIV